MTSNRETSASEKNSPIGHQHLNNGMKNRQAGRFLEIMVYAVGLVLVMIAAWYHNPHTFF